MIYDVNKIPTVVPTMWEILDPVSLTYDYADKLHNYMSHVIRNSPVAISITWKMVPHEILLWFPVHWAMLVQKLHDATLASLSVLKKSRWRPRWSP